MSAAPSPETEPQSPPPRAVGAAKSAFFFESGDKRLFAVWREPVAVPPRRAWVVCAPFAEEEKSARRTLAELSEELCARGDAVLLFAYSGTGDSEGHFSKSNLEAWRNDIRAACNEARRLAPAASPGLIGLRLGGALALQVAADVGAERLVLLEPVIEGRALLAALNQKKRLRAMMTKSGAGMVEVSTTNESSSTLDTDDDFDGWPLTLALRTELEKLDLTTPTPFNGPITLLQIGPRESLLPATESWARSLRANARALRMQPFWNLIDYAPAPELFATIPDW